MFIRPRLKTSCRPAGDSGSCWRSEPKEVKLIQSDGERQVAPFASASHRSGGFISVVTALPMFRRKNRETQHSPPAPRVTLNPSSLP